MMSHTDVLLKMNFPESFGTTERLTDFEFF